MGYEYHNYEDKNNDKEQRKDDKNDKDEDYAEEKYTAAEVEYGEDVRLIPPGASLFPVIIIVYSSCAQSVPPPPADEDAPPHPPRREWIMTPLLDPYPHRQGHPMTDPANPASTANLSHPKPRAGSQHQAEEETPAQRNPARANDVAWGCAADGIAVGKEKGEVDVESRAEEEEGVQGEGVE